MKDNFDDILKNKWEQIHFPVDEKHRQDMISLLDNQKRRRTGLLWWWTGLGSAVVAIATLMILQLNRQPEKPTLPAHSAIGFNKQETVTSTPNSQPEKTTIEDVTKTNINSEGFSASPASSANSTTASISSSSKTSASSSISSSVSSNPSTSASAKHQSAVEKESNEQSNKQVKNKVTRKAFADADRPDNASDLKAQQESFVIPNDILVTNEITGDSKESVREFVGSPVLTERNNDITSFLPRLDMQNLDYNINDDITTEATIIKRKPIRLFAEAGAGIVFASKPDYSSGWTINIGGGLDYALNQRTQLLFSGGYLLQNDGFDFERSSTVEQLSFGSRSSFHTLSPKKLHFVYAKAGLHYHIHRHVISIFGGVQYLYGAQGDISIQVEGDFLTPTTSTHENVWLKLDGMRRYLISSEVQYGYQITPKLSIHSGLRYYFTGIEAKDPELVQKGFYWNGKYSRISPFFTLNYNLYGTR